MVLPSRREEMPPTKKSEYPRGIELTATGLYDHDNKPLEKSTDKLWNYDLRFAEDLGTRSGVIEMGDSVELDRLPRKGA